MKSGFLRKLRWIIVLALLANAGACACGAIMLPRMQQLATWHRIDASDLPSLPAAPRGRVYHYVAHACEWLAAHRVTLGCSNLDQRMFICGTGMLPPEPLRLVAPWCDSREFRPGVSFDLPLAEEGVVRDVVGIGWPVPCFTGTVETTTKQTLGRVHGVIWSPDGTTASSYWDAQLIVPLRPAWGGIAADLVTWTLLISLAPVVWSAWQTVAPWVSRSKRRSLRGECMACGYPLTGASRCPECGTSAVTS